MPFKSEKQRRFLWSQHPDIARRWTKKYGSTPSLGAVANRLKKPSKSSKPSK